MRIISWEAYDILLYYSKEIKDIKYKSKLIKTKGENDPVTLADLSVNDLVFKRIKEKYSLDEFNILSEESTEIYSNENLMISDWVWVLDPLDGTKDFIEGSGDYAMHLALNYKKKPLLGVVLIPSKNELWIADGEKVWCERKDGSSMTPSMGTNKTLKEMTIVTSKNHRNETLKKLVDIVGFKEVKVMGSIGCKIASILRGESDIYISLSLPNGTSPKDWDFAAPEAILKTAGGAVTNIENEDLSYGGENFEQIGIIIASNNVHIHGQICQLLKEIIKNYNLYPF